MDGGGGGGGGGRDHSLALQGFAVLSSVTQLLQLVNQGGVNPSHLDIISTFVLFSLVMLIASNALPPNYTPFFVRMSFVYTTLACPLLLLPTLPHNLSWATFLSFFCPFLLLLHPFQSSIKGFCVIAWNSAFHALNSAYDAIARSVGAIHRHLSSVAASGDSRDGPKSPSAQGDFLEVEEGHGGCVT